LFELNASESSDDASLKPTLEYRWDFDGDGVWDIQLVGTDAGTSFNQLDLLIPCSHNPLPSSNN
jgi:hypothetical protein